MFEIFKPKVNASMTVGTLGASEAASVVVTPTKSKATAAPSRKGGTLFKGTTPIRRGYFESLNDNGDRAGVPIYGYGSPLLSDMTRDQLTAICRYLADNHPLAIYATGLKRDYSVPITVTSASPSPAWNTAADLYWKDLQHIIDFTGRFHFDSLQETWSMAVDTDGDFGLTMTDVRGFPQVQVVNSTVIRAPNNNTLFCYSGVQLDQFGSVLGYWLRTMDKMIPEPQMFLCYEPRNDGEYRGISPMQAGSNDARDGHEINAFAKGKAKAEQAMVMVLKTPDGTIADTDWDPNATQTSEQKTATPKLGFADFLGKDIPVIPSDHEIIAPDIKINQTDFQGMQDHLAGRFVMSIGFPPAFVLDSKLTGPNQRAVNDKVKKAVERRKRAMGRAATWVRNNAIAWAIAKGKLAPQVGWDKVSLQGPAELSIDMSQQTQDRDAVMRGMMTLRDYHGRRNKNYEAEMEQGFKEAEKIIKKCTDLSGGDKTLFTMLLARFLPTGTAMPITPDTYDNAP